MIRMPGYIAVGKNEDERNFCDNNLQKSTKQYVDKEPTCHELPY